MDKSFVNKSAVLKAIGWILKISKIYCSATRFYFRIRCFPHFYTIKPSGYSICVKIANQCDMRPLH